MEHIRGECTHDPKIVKGYCWEWFEACAYRQEIKAWNEGETWICGNCKLFVPDEDQSEHNVYNKGKFI